MTTVTAGLASAPLPPGETFFDALARQLLAFADTADGDLSAVRVLVPALPMAAELRAALQAAAQPGARPLLLPRFDTLAGWAAASHLSGLPAPLPDSQRLLLLYEALRDRRWFDEAALWGIAAEMAALFDELTAAAAPLPDDPAALAAQLERAYALRASVPLAFEARVVHELWRALSASGAPDAAAVYRLRLAALLRQAGEATESRPLFVLLDAPPDESLDAAERDFLRRYGECQPLRAFHPAPRESRATPLLAALDDAWPLPGALPLYERALAAKTPGAHSPLFGPAGAPRLRLIPCQGREGEARAAVAQIADWLGQGARRIALIAQDRLGARRARALLEREGVLVADETGWLLSTSRAAATVDALLETVAGKVYHRDLLDLCKSPFVFAETEEGERKTAVLFIEAAIRRSSAASGMARFRRALAEEAASAQRDLALALLDRVEAAVALLDARPASLARWLGRLDRALEAIGAKAALAGDVAGAVLLELLATRREELAANESSFTLAAWRDWFNRECEAASFRDVGIASPIVLTPLNAVCLRRFDAALLIGGDAGQLAPAAQGAFFNQSVRRELGLRTRADGERELRRDLELLIASVPQVGVTWQAMRDGEANLLAPELSLLSAWHALAWGDDLLRRPLPSRPEAPAEAATAPVATRPAAPAAPPGRLPRRVSVSAYATLVGCPYRFFARHVLGLGEMDEVAEEMDKSDYGALVHRTLELFHARHPGVADLPPAVAEQALAACVDEVFAPALRDNFLAVGWRARWRKRLAAYLDWQRQREAQGWRWQQAETPVSRQLPLADGGSVELYGRVDRIDRRAGDDGVALYDYKTQRIVALRERLKDDVQLPAYALLHGDAAEAAYVALDDETVADLSCGAGEDLAAEAARQGERLAAVFGALRAGAALPAHGAGRVCAHCEMSGLCRHEYVVEE